MLCQRCHKNMATVRYAEVVNGKVTDLHLCSDCLAVHQEGASAGFELSGPVGASRVAAARSEAARVRAPRVCKSCGTHLSNAIEAGTLGCSECYSAFADAIEPMLMELHGGLGHVGKNPQVDDSRVALRTDLQTKRSMLRNAVRDERYEQAALLRDEIQELESQLGVMESERE